MSAQPAISSILVVEDSDEDFAAMERILMKTTGALKLHRCSEAEQALSLLKKWQDDGERLPALIVLDLNLPGRDGRYVLSELRRESALRRLPVVIFSTSSSPEDVAWCYENGANAYHVKNMEYSIFKSAVEQLSSYWLRSAALPPTGSYGAS